MRRTGVGTLVVVDTDRRGFSPRIREHGIGLKQVRGDDPVETSDRIESRQDGFSQLALA